MGTAWCGRLHFIDACPDLIWPAYTPLPHSCAPGEVEREALGRLIFSDPAARRRLNAATHLPVLVELAARVLWHWLTMTWVLVRTATVTH